MIDPCNALKPAVIAALVVAGLTAVRAQEKAPSSDGVTGRLESLQRDTSGFFGQLFGDSERFGGSERSGRRAAQVQMAQVSPSELVVRLDRLENQIRQLTGLVEQLQFRNQQLEQQLRNLQGDPGGVRPPLRPQSVQPMPPMPGPPPQRRSDVYEPDESATVPNGPGGPRPLPRRADVYEPNEPPNAPGGPRPFPRRGDVFDPNENPNAPGAPRVLGSLPSGPSVITGDPSDDGSPTGPPIGAPGGRQAGAPLDLSTLSERAATDPSLAVPNSPSAGVSGALPPPPPRNPSATGALHQPVPQQQLPPPPQQAMLPPTATAKDEYDLAYGYLLRKDYALAEDGFRQFIRKHPADRLNPDANYWLGESLFQRQRYRDAAESFLTVSTKFEKSGKAPDALLRLGQSLAALKEKEAACATFAEIGRKYPRASPGVKQGVEREQKRAGC